MTTVSLSGAGASEMASGLWVFQIKTRLVTGRTTSKGKDGLGVNINLFFSGGFEPSIRDNSPPVIGAFVQVKSSSRSGGRSGNCLARVFMTSWQATKAPNRFQ